MTPLEAQALHNREKELLRVRFSTMTRAQKEALILAATRYKSGEDSVNTVYLGSLALSMVVHALGGKYGVNSVYELLPEASEEQLVAALDPCTGVIRYMEKHPVDRCPLCGQIVPVKLACD